MVKAAVRSGRGVLAVLFLSLLVSCLVPAGGPEVLVTVRVDDTLTTFDSVRILLLAPEPSEDTLEVLWDGPLEDTADLRSLKTRRYRGGAARIVITAYEDGEAAYLTVTRYPGKSGPSVVETVQVADRNPPELRLLDSLSPRYASITWSGGPLPVLAVCLDRRDGRFAPDTLPPALRRDQEGVFVLRLVCQDRSGNRSPADSIRLEIRRAPDLNPPVLILLGQDSLDHDFGNVYADAGAVCSDDRDGNLPIERSGSVDVTVLGVNELTFACRDAAGNAPPSRKRTVRVVRYEYIDAHKDAAIDTVIGHSGFQANAGCTPLLTFTKMEIPYSHAFPLAFEIDHVDRARLKSAKAAFQTYISGPAKPFSDLKVTFRIFRVKRKWEEGDGSWYFRAGEYFDRGETFLGNYAPKDEVWARAKDPWYGGGITGENGREVVRSANLDAAGLDTVRLSYPGTSFSLGSPGVVPSRGNLVQVEVDLTEYVKGTAPGEDYGLIIMCEGVPEDIWINWATRELGDGTLGPRLRLTY